MLTWVFIPIYVVLFATEWRTVLQEPVRLLFYLAVPVGSLLLHRGTRWSLPVRGTIAIGLLSVLTVPALLQNGLRQPSVGVTAIMTMVFAVMLLPKPKAVRWMAALVLAAAAGVLLRSVGWVTPAGLVPFTPFNDLMRTLLVMSGAILVATLPMAAVRIYEEASAAQRREYELRLEAERRSQELQRQQFVGTLAKGMAHDLANLLQTVGAGMELLRETGDTAYRMKVVDEISTVTDRATETLRALLSVGRPAESDARKADMHALCERLGSIVPPLVGSRITVSMQCEASRPVALTLNELEQVILNLIFNARDAMPHGGTLSVTATDESLSRGAGTARNGVRLRVTDSGCGIAPELLPRIFDAYVTTKETVGGSGLGLSIVSRLVHGANGTIEAASVPGQGTTFSVWLPAA